MATGLTVLKKIWTAWKWVGSFIVRLLAFVCLCIVYFLIITPLSLLTKLMGKDILEVKERKGLETYTQSSSHSDIKRMENQF